MTYWKRGIVFLAVCASACATAPDASIERPDEDSVDEAQEASPAAAKETEASAAPTSGHLLLQIRDNHGSLQLVSVTPVNTPLPKWRGKPRSAAWQSRSFSDSQALLHTGPLPDPHEVRGEFADPVTGQLQHVSFTRKDAVDFVVRVPANTTKVDFHRGGANAYATPIGSVTLPKR